MNDLTSPWPIHSANKLAWLLGAERGDIKRLAKIAGRLYEPFDIIRPGKDPRHIDNPKGELKAFQRTIYNRLLVPVPLPDRMLGGRRGKSIKDNAAPHVGMGTLVTIDLRNCFPRIHDRCVFEVFFRQLGACVEVASLLTKLTTFQHRLPQGAPTSLTLANLCLLPLYEEVQGIADELDLACTFYVDDISLSGARARDAIEPVVRIIQRHGHAVRQQKIHVMKSQEPQRVTGLSVNRVLGVGGQRLRRIRQTIHALSLRSVITERERRSIYGAVAQIRSINERQGDALKRYADGNLPRVSIPGEAVARRIAHQPCRCSRRHRLRRDLAEADERGQQEVTICSAAWPRRSPSEPGCSAPEAIVECTG